jgi:methyl coenzyme M reductase subunit D
MFSARLFPPQILDAEVTFRLIKTIYRTNAIDSYVSELKKLETVAHSEPAIN